MARGLGKNQEKILLLLLGGLALGLSGSPKRYFQIIKGIKEGLKEIDNRALRVAIKELYKSKLISEKENPDGTITMILTEKGEKKALTYNLDEMTIKKPAEWDKKWRMVVFDIPERIKWTREAMRRHLKNLGFYEFQKSVFVHPYDCKDEIEYLIEFYDIRRFVRFVVAESLDNELHLKREFELLS
jgi:DNA-binding transcriptional regulator PaaX